MTVQDVILLDSHIEELGLEEVGRSDFFSLFEELFGRKATEKDYEKYLQH